MNIGEFLIKLRVQRNISPAKLAKSTGISRSVMSEYESNITTPSLNRFFQLMSFYGIDKITAVLGKEMIDISGFSEVGKQKIMQIVRDEQNKSNIKNI